MVLAAVVLTGCAASDGDEGAAAPPDDADATSAGAPRLEHDGTVLWLAADDGATVLAELDEPGTALVHAVARPTADGTEHGDGLTVLVLTRTEPAGTDARTVATDADAVGADDPGQALTVARYELRYVTVLDGTPGPLYAFPWRLQVDEDLAGVLDVAPLPVWSPDGDAVAWVEWVEDGVRLRTVGWFDDGASSNPSDDAVAYHLDEVPAGVQLDRWETATDGRAVLRGTVDDEVWRIQVDPGRGTVVAPTDRTDDDMTEEPSP